MNIDRLTETEREFALSARDLGFKVIRGGYPDFALTHSEIGPFFVEVKNASGLSDDQKTMMEFLAKAGMPSYISYGKFPRLGNPYYPVKVREPRCELCAMNTTYERVCHKANSTYHNKWATKIYQLERKLKRVEQHNRSLITKSKKTLRQLKEFNATVTALESTITIHERGW